jgi:type II secretory pathway pseudopilin PulG
MMKLRMHISKKIQGVFSSPAAEGGFSLIELLVGLGVAAVGVIAVIGVFTTLTRSYTAQNASAGVQEAARAGIEYLSQNIRMAGLNPMRLNDFGIISATPTYIEFTVDRNLNGELDEVDEETMAFSFDPAAGDVDEGLYVASGSESWSRLVGDVTDLTFSYLDKSGNDLGGAPDPASIKTVEILLTVAQPAGRGETLSRTYSSRIICRNLGL